MHAICWTLIHSIWQGALAAVLAGVVILLTRRAPAIIRYRLLTATLVLFVVGVAVTFFRELGERGLQGTQLAELHLIADYQPHGQPHPEPSSKGLFGSAAENVSDFLNSHASLIVNLWLLCLFLQMLRLMGGLYGIHRVRRNATPLREWEDTLTTLCDRIGIYWNVHLLESAAVKVPAAVGFFKPAIFVPLGLFANLPVDQVEAILLHELAHIRRNDYVTNLLLQLTSAIFFFNPGMRWLTSLIRRERETCCDDIVLAFTEDHQSYVDALMAI